MIDIGVQSVFLHLMHTLNCPERSSENKDMCVNLNNGVTGVTGDIFEYHITPQRLSQWLQIVTWYVNMLDTCLEDMYPAPTHLEWARSRGTKICEFSQMAVQVVKGLKMTGLSPSLKILI